MASIHSNSSESSLGEHPDESFEALIDLLAFDDNMQTLFSHSEGASGDGLRDAQGKLDFDKIYLMLSERNLLIATSHEEDTGTKCTHAQEVITAPPLPTPRRGTKLAEATHHEAEVRPGNLSVRSSTSPGERHIPGVSFSNESNAEQPIAAIDAVLPVPESIPGQIFERSTLEDPRLEQPGSLEASALTQALSLANKEISDLRQQCDRLSSLVLHSVPAHDTRVTTITPESHDYIHPSSQQSDIPSLSLCASVSPEFAALTEQQCKQLLTILARSLTLPPSSLFEDFGSRLYTQRNPRSVADISRALDFVLRVDDLIWRRGLPPAPTEASTVVFTAENVEALIDRLYLWEQAVRLPRK